VACSVLALSHLIILKTNFSVDFFFLFSLFFATVFGYNFVKYFGLAKFHYRSLTTKLKEIQILSILCVFGFTICFLQLKSNVQWSLLFLGIITFFYAMPLKWFSNNSLRKISGLKIYIIAFVWAITTALLPQLNGGLEVFELNYIWVLERFVFIFILMLPFEIRDMNFDDLKLSTIPQKIGLFNTKKLAYFGILVLIFFLYSNTSKLEIISTSIMLTILCVFIVKSRPQNSFYYTAFWVEALPIFWWLMSISLEILHESGTL
jgi:hypothetical protein